MNKTTMTLFATTIMLCLSATVMAQPGQGRPGDRGPGGRGGPGGEQGERGGRGGPGGERGGPGGEQGGPGDMSRMMEMIPVLAALDADHDGVISKSEIENATAALKKLDKNGDGDLDQDELRPQRTEGGRGGPGGQRGGAGGPGGERGGPGGEGGEGGGAEAVVKRLMSQDKNEDGKISKEEAPERMQTMFDRLDANSDGFLDKTEVEAMATRMGGRSRGGAGGERGGRRGGGGEEGGQRPKRPEFDQEDK